jgi:beta-lactamase regulating signal transducer with metallopeptidase domain/lipopolysaccharide export system protein LptA
MTAVDVLDALLKVNLVSGAAIIGLVAVRKAARSLFGARLAYGLWLLPVLAGAAVLLPARQVVVVRSAAPMLATFRIGRDLSVTHMAAAPTGAGGPAMLVGLWLAGVIGAALFMAVLQHRFIARARRGGVGPAVVGLIAPRILIPKDFAERYSPSEQALVLAHEQAHLARQDSRLNGLAAALQCLNWFNPLVHLAARLMRVDQELACDEAVANRYPDARRAYAEVLLKAQMAVLPLPLGCYWPSRAQHPLVERVAMLKRPRIGRTRWRAGAAVLGCLWAGAGVAAWASQPTQVRTVFKASQAPDSPAALALAQAGPPPQPIIIRPPTPAEIQQMASGDLVVRVADNPLINQLKFEGNANLQEDQLRAVMKERPGGVFSGRNLDRDVAGVIDLYRDAGWPDAKVTFKVVNLPQQRVDLTLIVNEGAKRPPGDPLGPISIAADQVNREDAQHRVVFRGNVVTVQKGRRVLSDLLVATSRAPNEPGGLELKEVRWEGDVRFDMGDQAATADLAVFDGKTKTVTLSGHVVVQRGPWVVRNDRLVIDVKDK